jgi:hypothetical protein
MGTLGCAIVDCTQCNVSVSFLGKPLRKTCPVGSENVVLFESAFSTSPSRHNCPQDSSLFDPLGI